MPDAPLSLTFDDGPDVLWTPRVLVALEQCGVRATFFLVGARVRQAPQLVELIASAGHEIALHCDRHIRHTDLSEAEIEADTRVAMEILGELGHTPTRWRTPWGICTPASVRVAERHGLELVHWTLDTHDWRGDSAAEMLEDAAIHLQPGAIVLLHDALGPGALRKGCENTVALIRPLCVLAGVDVPAALEAP